MLFQFGTTIMNLGYDHSIVNSKIKYVNSSKNDRKVQPGVIGYIFILHLNFQIFLFTDYNMYIDK